MLEGRRSGGGEGRRRGGEGRGEGVDFYEMRNEACEIYKCLSVIQSWESAIFRRFFFRDCCEDVARLLRSCCEVVARLLATEFCQIGSHPF